MTFFDIFHNVIVITYKISKANLNFGIIYTVL